MTETVEQFLARGGEITHIPRGAMVTAGWKPDKLHTAGLNAATAAEREKRGMRRDVHVEATARAEHPTSKRPKEGQGRKRRGIFGKKTKAIADAIAAEPLSPKQIAERTDFELRHVYAMLANLERFGFAERASTGYGTTTWRLVREGQ